MADIIKTATREAYGNALVEFAINLVLGTAVCRALYAVTKDKL